MVVISAVEDVNKTFIGSDRRKSSEKSFSSSDEYNYNEKGLRRRTKSPNDLNNERQK